MSSIRAQWVFCRWRLLGLATLTGVGFYTKFYRGIGEFWVNTSLGGVFYVMFWSALWDLLRPHHAAGRITVWVLVATAFLEVLQLVHTPFLEAVRSSFIGRTLIGTSFALSDFFYYVVGSGLGYLWVSGMRNVSMDEAGGGARE
tara:strand:- start:826 stop:1257 length:432 start_codon:yes stop_codon:yes gene_type:complete